MEGRQANSEFSSKLKLRIYTWSVRLVNYLRTLSRQKENFLSSIINQLLRSGTSVGANYVEAIGSPSTKDFRKFLSYSLKSGNESLYWLSLIKDTGIDNSAELQWLITELQEITKILGKSVSTLYKK